ncbi:MAG: phosphomannose isomerase type II C-terminal cupin domain [Candidatus Aminicenantes bacterium]|nr:phosphomannose isomerase type II C-terminal cupin domain [Candidatus Aminicenantes bacterium]
MSEKIPSADDYRSGIVEDVRPWGRFRRFPHEAAGSIKIITVEPGGRLSLQYHEGRAEFWVVLDAGLEITVGDRVWIAAPNEEIVVPRRAVHRARNAGTAPARFMEIWIGQSSEADIVRLQDDYQRK